MFNFSGFIKHVEGIIAGKSKFETHPQTVQGHLQLLWEAGVMMALSLTLPLFGFCLIGTGYCAWRFPKYSTPILFLAASYYLLFFNVALQLKVRFLIPIVIITAFFGGKLLADISHQAPLRLLVRGGICLFFAYAALFPIQLDLLLMQDPRYEAEQWLRTYTDDGDIVETFAPKASAFKHYPRMPSWVKMRGSQMAAGSRWLTRSLPPNMIMFPNIYMGQETPDYIVLTEFFYTLSHRDESGQSTFLNDLVQGRTPYTQVATFKTPTWIPIRYLPINSRITIFAQASGSIP